MILFHFFQYNWQVRDEWLTLLKDLPPDELLKERVGGVGSILYTFFHIIDVEYSWLRCINGKEDVLFDYSDYQTLDRIRNLSNERRTEIIENFPHDVPLDQQVFIPWDSSYQNVNAILHHIIAHEIHHIGQLSIWARELNLHPVSASYIDRKF